MNIHEVILSDEEAKDLVKQFNLRVPADRLAINLSLRKYARAKVKPRHNPYLDKMPRSQYYHIVHSEHYIGVEKALGLI